MLGSRVPGQRWLFVLLVSATAMTVWHAGPVAEDELAAERPVRYRYYVPLLGLPLDDAIAEAEGEHDAPPLETPPGPVKTCLPFLAPILEYPNWQLRITSGASNCSGDVVHQTFAIASTGEVTWTQPGGPARHLVLSREQLALVRRLDELSCVGLQPRDSESGWVQIGLDLGKHVPYGGARIWPASELGRAVTAMLDDLAERYRRPRREVIGSMDLRLATTERGPVYRVRVTGGRLTVKRGRKLLVDEPVDPDLLVDLADSALELPAADAPDVKGVLLLHGRSVPVSFWRYDRGPFELIIHAIARARVNEAESRALAGGPGM